MKKIIVFLAAFIGLNAAAHAQNGFTVSIAGNDEKIVNIPSGHRVLFPFKDAVTKTYYVVIRPDDELDCKKFKIYYGFAGKPFSELTAESSTNLPGSIDYTFTTSSGKFKFTRGSSSAVQEKDGKEIQLERIQ
jgi:hypothetical protein